MTISCLAQISKWLEKEGLCFLLFSHTLGLNASTYLKVSISRSAPPSRKKIKVAPNKGSDWFAVCFSGLHANSKSSTFFFLNIVSLCQEAVECVKELQSPSTHHVFVTLAFNHTVEQKESSRKAIGRLFHFLLRDGVLTNEQYLTGYVPLLLVLHPCPTSVTQGSS